MQTALHHHGLAVFDVAYLSGTRTRLFAALPELELPRGFRRAPIARWISAIASARTRTMVSRRLIAWGVIEAGRT